MAACPEGVKVHVPASEVTVSPDAVGTVHEPVLPSWAPSAASVVASATAPSCPAASAPPPDDREPPLPTGLPAPPPLPPAPGDALPSPPQASARAVRAVKSATVAEAIGEREGARAIIGLPFLCSERGEFAGTDSRADDSSRGSPSEVLVLLQAQERKCR